MFTRREFGKLAISGLVLPRFDGLVASLVSGVRLGVQTYSFRDLPRPQTGDAVDVVVAAMKECGLDECELWATEVEPRLQSGRAGSPEAQAAREEMRRWRVETPIDHFNRVKQKFDAAHISIYAYNYSFNAGMTDDEIDRGFAMAKALGAEIITASTTLRVAKRVVPFADKHKMIVAMHGHSNTKDPNEFCTPDSFAAALAMSPYYRINLDIGHFVAADFDPVAFIREQHAHITNLHVKDRRKNQGPSVPFGQGDTPIREVLRLLRQERWPIRAYVEYEYEGEGTPVEEVKKCLAYARQALA